MATHRPIIVQELYGELQPAVSPAAWQVFHTKPQCEKKLAQLALEAHISYYLPQYKSERIYNKRKVLFTKPLLPGYIFVLTNPDDKVKLLQSGYVVQSLRIPNELALLAELGILYKGSISDMNLQPHPYLQSGIAVRINSGPFIGLTGQVKSYDSLHEVVLTVDLLRESVSFITDPNNVELLEKL